MSVINMEAFREAKDNAVQRGVNIDPAILEAIMRERPHNVVSFYHGAFHWTRVCSKAMYLCGRYPKADRDVAWHFAYLHDVCRENEDVDPGHGPRAVQWVTQPHIRQHINLDDQQFRLLCYAMSGHTHAHPDHGKSDLLSNITVNVCWDADRLDIGRIGVVVDPGYLFTPMGKFLASCEREQRTENEL